VRAVNRSVTRGAAAESPNDRAQTRRGYPPNEPPAHPPRHALGFAATLIVLTAAATGCSGQDDTSGLPDISEVTTPPATPTGSVLTAGQQAVADAVAHYEIVIAAMTGGEPVDMKKITAVTVNPWRQKVADNVFKLQAQKQRVRGKHQAVVSRVRVNGDAATYVECSDSSRREVVSMGPEPTHVAGGTPPELTTFSLVRLHHKWFVKNVQGGKKCHV
jgi:hypothetical protein